MKTVSWLPPQAQEWVDLYGYFLDGVWARFEADGEWPDPVEVQRELRSADRSRRVTQALDRMPPFFARREYAPPRLALTIFGLGCCDGARPLLEQYLAVAKLALERFDSPTLPNRLRREDVVAELDLSPDEADRLSVVLSQYAPFLGSGEISIEKWDREVDPQAEEFEGIEGVDDLLEILARKQRVEDFLPLLPPPPVPAPSHVSSSVPTGGASPYEKLMLGAALISAIAAMVSLGLTLASSLSPVALSFVGLFTCLTVALLILRRPLWRAAQQRRHPIGKAR